MRDEYISKMVESSTKSKTYNSTNTRPRTLCQYCLKVKKVDKHLRITRHNFLGKLCDGVGFPPLSHNCTKIDTIIEYYNSIIAELNNNSFYKIRVDDQLISRHDAENDPDLMLKFTQSWHLILNECKQRMHHYTSNKDLHYDEKNAKLVPVKPGPGRKVQYTHPRVRVQVQVHPDDRHKIIDYAKKLNKSY